MKDRRDLLAAGVSVAVLVALTAWVSHSTPALDVWGKYRLATHHHWLRGAASVVLTLLSPPVFVLALLGYAAARSYRRLDRRSIVLAAAVVAVLAVTVIGLKYAVGRPSPYPGETDAAFPSGHTASALTCCGTAVLLGARRSVRAWAFVAATTSVEIVALLLRSSHWLTDIAAGLSIAFALLVVAARCSRRPERAPLPGH